MLSRLTVEFVEIGIRVGSVANGWQGKRTEVEHYIAGRGGLCGCAADACRCRRRDVDSLAADILVHEMMTANVFRLVVAGTVPI